ncbi:MAG: sulfite exporter TauE/SafE family protein [Magnetococcales bacterium]|nr:sulfite exporter TauE/SafE family protein [Magnetococcales bacterium]
MDVTGFSFIPAFLLGLASLFHCVGMCGGILGAVSMSLPPAVRQDRRRLLLFVLLINLGRITSYTLGGFLAGWLGQGLTLLPEEMAVGHRVLQFLAGLILVGAGLQLAGWLPALAGLERLGAGLWRALQPLWRRFMPVDSPLRAWGAGLVWGWLPCFLVYAALLMAAASGAPLRGAMAMAAFGLGTLPATVTTGLLAGWLLSRAQQPRWRRLVAILLILLGLAGMAWPGGAHHHSMEDGVVDHSEHMQH